MRASLRSTSTRTFVAVPVAVAAEQLLRRRAVHLAWAPLLGWGYLQYRLAGTYRRRLGGGPPGMSQGHPERLVTTGVYAYTRNPMYLGHLIFLVGLTLMTRSPVALAVTAGSMPWFDARARTDESRLAKQFGAQYTAYRDRVPRWIGRMR